MLAAQESSLPFVEELSATTLQALQQQTAATYGLPPFFQDTLRDGMLAPRLAVIPAGRFEMGSGAQEFGHRREEYPQHLVTLNKPFAIGQYPVTAEEFGYFKDDTEWHLRPELIWHKGRYPVINVRIGDVKLYLAWLSQQTGHTYRLPSEAEWEYATRAGTQTPFCFGQHVTCKEVNFNPLFPYRATQEKRRWLPRCMPSVSASEVGLRAANAWGLHDVHGNVWEFTGSHWANSHLSANRDGSPSHHADPHWYVTKGGSWFDPAVLARSAARKKRYLDELDTNLGFRVVREL